MERASVVSDCMDTAKFETLTSQAKFMKFKFAVLELNGSSKRARFGKIDDIELPSTPNHLANTAEY